MSGSPAIAGVIARWSFFILLTMGWWRGELKFRGIARFLLLWLAGLVAFQYATSPYDGLFSPYVATLDVALVFAVFKGDVRLT